MTRVCGVEGSEREINFSRIHRLRKNQTAFKMSIPFFVVKYFCGKKMFFLPLGTRSILWTMHRRLSYTHPEPVNKVKQ